MYGSVVLRLAKLCHLPGRCCGDDAFFRGAKAVYQCDDVGLGGHDVGKLGHDVSSP